MDTKLKQYYVLCKPKVLFLMITTSWVGMYLSKAPWPGMIDFIGISLGIFLIAAFGAVLNQFFEDIIDAQMKRTSKRPLVKKLLTHQEVTIFSMMLVSFGSLLLLYFANTMTLLLTLGGALGYACVYTLYLKHQTSQNIVIGGLYGALPPLLGWCALTNSVDSNALLLPLIIFVWTPPHFWALAIDRLQDYKQAQIPMLPVTHGVRFTSIFILLYNLLLFSVTALPYVTGMFSLFYLVLSLCLNFIYFIYNIELFYQKPRSAVKSFKFSIVYLYVLFLVMFVDRAIFAY